MLFSESSMFHVPDVLTKKKPLRLQVRSGCVQIMSGSGQPFTIYREFEVCIIWKTVIMMCSLKVISY